MYAFKDPFPYAYALIAVLNPNLILKYLFYNFYLLELKKLFGEKLNWKWSCISVCGAVEGGGGMGWRETTSVKIYHATTSGTFNWI